jgi:hypothetical protein
VFREPAPVVVNREEQHHNGELYPTTTEDSPPSATSIRGVLSKTRVYGHGHWMNTHSLVSFNGLQA